MRRFLTTLAFVMIAALATTLLVSHSESFRRLWSRWLVVSVPMDHADALIVLGGEPLARPKEAARLYAAGVAPRVFVTGIGDAEQNRRVLLESGVPAYAITVEPSAFSTFTNVLFLKPLLASAHVKSALLVTSPFHTRRALATFRKVIPGVSFGITDASIGWWNRPEGLGDVNRFALIELLKTLEYWLLYGVSPASGSGSGK